MISKVKILVCLICVSILFLFSACSGMVKTTRMVDGRKVTMWVDPETAERMEEEEKLKAARMERINNAEKRKPDEPIIVALFETEVAENLKKSVNGRLFQQFRKEFENDKIIKLLDQKIVNRAAKSTRWTHTRLASSKSTPSVRAHVCVKSRAYIKQLPGYNKKTGKLGTMVQLVLSADISSSFMQETYTVEENGNIFNNVQVTEDFANKIKKIIKSEIGSNLPANAFGSGNESIDSKAIADWLKSLKK